MSTMSVATTSSDGINELNIKTQQKNTLKYLT